MLLILPLFQYFAIQIDPLISNHLTWMASALAYIAFNELRIIRKNGNGNGTTLLIKSLNENLNGLSSLGLQNNAILVRMAKVETIQENHDLILTNLNKEHIDCRTNLSVGMAIIKDRLDKKDN
jgi:hypothetical protein